MAFEPALEGTIAKFHNVKGWGFITTEDGTDAFFIRDDCPDGRAFMGKSGDCIYYDSVEVTAEGKKRALGVRQRELAEPGLSLEDDGSGELKARVASFYPQKGWGFITPADGEDAFFIRDECPEGHAFMVQPGEIVIYDEIQVRDDGKRRATGVRRTTNLEAAEIPGGGMRATVCNFNPEKGWGFITTEDGQDAFLIRDECVEGRAFNASKGDIVVYQSIEVREDGKFRAKGVRMLSRVGGHGGGGGFKGKGNGKNHHGGGGGGCVGGKGFGGKGFGGGGNPAIVANFNPQKGWGFITTAQGEDAFFIRDETAEGQAFNVSKGEPVFYDSIELRPDGKKRASGVRRAMAHMPIGMAFGGCGGKAGMFMPPNKKQRRN